jgi:hypothetical protein
MKARLGSENERTRHRGNVRVTVNSRTKGSKFLAAETGRTKVDLWPVGVTLKF